VRSASGCFNAPPAPMETVKRRPSHCAFVERLMQVKKESLVNQGAFARTLLVFFWYRVILRTRSMHPEPYSRRYAGMPRRCRGTRQRQNAHKFFRLVVVALDSHCAVVATVQRMHVQRESMPRMPLRYCAQRRRRGQIATIDIVYEDGRGHQQNEARSRCGLTHRAGSDRSGA
jgi:hypothetical protein